MIPVQPRQEPETFRTDVHQRGHEWLVTHPCATVSQLPDYWNDFREDVQMAFHGCCAYLGFPIASGQIDHFIAKADDRQKAYEWDNYRWSEPRVNMLKNRLTFLDPFTIQCDWVAIDPATLEYYVTNQLPANLAVAGENTISVLNDGELLRGRKRILEAFIIGNEWNIDGLKIFFPLLAKAVEESV